MRFTLSLPPQQRVYAAFAIYSFSVGNFFPRLPDLKQAMGVGEGALGLGLIGAPVGTLVALTFAAPLLDRIGYRLAVLLLLPLIALGYAVTVHATTPLELFLILIPIGLLIGGAEVIVSVEADRVEAMTGRRIMNRAHSFWSIGFFAAGVFGAGMAQLGLSPQLHLALVVPLVCVCVWVLLGTYQPAPPRLQTTDTEAPRFALPTMAILILLSVTVSAMLLEGASMDWSAIYMRTVFDSGPFLTGITVAAFAIAQFTARYFADSYVERHSPRAVGRTLLAVLGAGTLVVCFSQSAYLSLLGFALMGAGTSTLFPLAISAAARRTDRPAATNVASITQISFGAFLLGPPLLGFVGEHWGIRWTFGLGLPLIVLSYLMANALGSRPVVAGR